MSKTLPKTLTEFSQFAAKQFLQTAVFIDDNIYNRQTGAVGEPNVLKKPLPKRKAALKSAKSTQTAKTTAASNESTPTDDYSPQEIVTSFAKMRILCSLYQPKRDASVGQNSDAYELCLASDIVIIDWELYGDAGKKAKELVANLIKQSLNDIPEQLRLVLIYTKEMNLESVASDVYDKLYEVLPQGVNPQEEDQGLALHTPNTRVVVLGKSGGRRPAKYKAYEVNEKDMASRAVTEFSKLASGMLQGAVLLGLAEIRQNSRKMLTKFDLSLDPAFLTHRGLLIENTEDAADHVLPLLVGEIQSVLEDQLPNPIVSEELIEDWCANLWIPQSHVNSIISSGDPHKIARDFCLKGHKALNVQGLTRKKIYSFLHNSPTSKANHRLGVLMSQRTHYGNVPRRFKLGAIVKDQSGKFLICLQPVCDSVRIPSTRKFLMVELQESTNGKFNTVIFDKDKPVELLFTPKSFLCVVAEFQSSGSEPSVVATEQGEGTFAFTSSSGEIYCWIAQLKVEHAQRISEQFARELSRVGLTESEWLRKMID